MDTKPNQWVVTNINQNVANRLMLPSKQFQIVPIKFCLLFGISSVMYKNPMFVLVELKKPHVNITAPKK